jgi:aquaglyceroporin related protein
MNPPPITQAKLPSQFPLRTADSSDSTLRRSSDALRQGQHAEAVPYSPTVVNGQPGNDVSTFKNGIDSPTSGYDSELGDRPELRKVTSTLTGPRAWLGLQPVAPVQEEHDHAHHNHMWWSKIKITLKEPMAEFWGTFILVLFGMADAIMSSYLRF